MPDKLPFYTRRSYPLDVLSHGVAPIQHVVVNKTLMKKVILLVTSLLLISLTVHSQEMRSGKVKLESATSDEAGLIKVSIMYPSGEGKTFDMEYYETLHMPMVAGFLGSNLVKYTIDKGIASGAPNQPPAYVAIGTFFVKSLADYQAAIAPNRDAIRADFPKYTNIAPVILISEVVK